ncbi:MAG: RNA polymerase sigma factor [Candidatus Zixiibacteriota bacterium]|nr:MAG: RNA polymerase sigma factor [candidate division Zixibacteria bacterium]
MIESLYEQARGGDSTAEDELFERLSARFDLLVRRKIWNSQDCEEIVQDALTAVLQNYKRTAIRVSFSAWAQRILENKVTDFYRAQSRRKPESSELDETVVPASSWSPDPVFRMSLMECLRKVNALNRNHARMLVLSYQGLGIEEICTRLGINKSNAYSVLSRARSMLARCLEKGEPK